MLAISSILIYMVWEMAWKLLQQSFDEWITGMAVFLLQWKGGLCNLFTQRTVMKHTALLRVCCGTNGLPYMLRVNTLKAMTEQATLRGGALNLLQSFGADFCVPAPTSPSRLSRKPVERQQRGCHSVETHSGVCPLVTASAVHLSIHRENKQTRSHWLSSVLFSGAGHFGTVRFVIASVFLTFSDRVVGFSPLMRAEQTH